MFHHKTIQEPVLHRSESEEMYLNTIARLAESGGCDLVPLSRVAGMLGVQPVSTHQMVRKLAEQGLVAYAPYKGVRLTAEGLAVAARVLRARRLWQVFLCKHLALRPEEADAVACRLEHVTPAAAVDRLDRFLGRPKVSPDGKPIPGAADVDQSSVPVCELGVGRCGEIAAFDVDEAAAVYLTSAGLRLRQPVRVAAQASDGSLLLILEGAALQVDRQLAQAIRVTPSPGLGEISGLDARS